MCGEATTLAAEQIRGAQVGVKEKRSDWNAHSEQSTGAQLINAVVSTY